MPDDSCGPIAANPDRPRFPVALRLHVTDRCTHRCVMCDRWSWPAAAGQQGRSELTREEYAVLFRELAAGGTRGITFTGGEPLLRTDLAGLLADAVARGLRCSITTNGDLLAPRLPELLGTPVAPDRSPEQTGPLAVAVSLLGATAATHEALSRSPGAFARATASLRAAVDSGIATTVFYTVVPANVSEAAAAFDLAAVLGVRGIRYGLLHGYGTPGFTRADLEVLAAQLAAAGLTRDRLCEARGQAASVPHLQHERRLLSMLLDGTIPEADLRARTLARPVLFRGLCCPSVGRLAFLNPYGEVFPCHYAEFSNQEFGQWAALRQRFMMGSVRDSSFGEVWHGERYASFRRRISPIREDDEELCTVCAQCSELCASAAPARLRGAAR